MNRTPFDELQGDSLDDLLDPNAPRRAQPVAPANYQSPAAVGSCPKCGGTGLFRGWSGRSSGPCFACKGGKGARTYKTSREVRQERRVKAVASRAKKRADALATWQTEFPAEWAWLLAASGRGFQFAVSLHEAVVKYGALSENQIAAARRCMVQDAARDAGRAAERAAREAAAQVIDMTKITAAFQRAASILQYPKLRVAGVVFGLPGTDSPARAAGVVYVRSEERVYLGKITGGRFVRSRECTDEQEAAVLAAAVDPQEAAIRYGRLTGNCACCGRLLMAEDSLGRGIGPICAERFGW